MIRRSWVRAALVGVLAVATAAVAQPGVGGATASTRARPPAGESAGADPTPEQRVASEALLGEAREMGVDGLEVGTGRCAGALQVPRGGCTHGPDPLPPGVTAEGDAVTPPVDGAAAVAAPSCEGDGVSGYRVEVIYAHATGTPDRYAEYLTSFRAWVAEVDNKVSASAAQTGGSRRVRWVTDGACNVVVHDHTLSAATLGEFQQTWDELADLGYNRPDRKYLVFADWSAGYCGIGGLWPDDRETADNWSNQNPSGSSYPAFALATEPCWDETTGRTATHELFHNLGAVQNSAPNSTGAGHCDDGTLTGSDVMCYAENGHVATDVCDAGLPKRLDCNHDDYFHTHPTGGSYLVSHWNTADSRFLVGGNDDFGHAYPLSGGVCQDAVGTSTNVGATTEAGEANHLGQGSSSVWFTWTADRTGSSTISTAGSTFDTVLAAYTGSSVGALGSPVAQNDNDPGGGTHSKVSVNATAGTTYRIAVDGVGSAAGDVTLAVHTTSSPVPGDCFAAPRSAAEGRTTFASVGASLEGAEGGLAGQATVWFSFTPAASGTYVIDTSGSADWGTDSYDPMLAVFQGSSLAGLETLGADNDLGPDADALVRVALVGGTSYRIAVGGDPLFGPEFADTTSGILNITLTGRLVNMAPTRLVDSRNGTGTTAGRFVAGQPRTVTAKGVAGVPADAIGVVLAISVVGPTKAGFLRAWPAGVPEPASTVSNFVAKQSVTNVAMVRPGTAGGITVKVYSADAHVVIDVLGYFSPSGGSGYEPVTATRLVDTRTGVGGSTVRLAPGEVREYTVRGVAGVPADTTGALAVFSAVDPSAAGFLRVYPSGAAAGGTVVNWRGGASISGTVVAGIGPNGKTTVCNCGGGAIDLVIDVVGAFRPSSDTAFVPLTPARMLDSRTAIGTVPFPWAPGETRVVPLADWYPVPDGARPAVSLSAVTPTGNGYVRVGPSEEPLVTTVLNFRKGENITNLVVATPDDVGDVDIRNYGSGSVHLVADVSGYFL